MLTLVVCASPFTSLGPSSPSPRTFYPTLAVSRIWALFALDHTDELWVGKMCSLVNSDSHDLHHKSLLVGGSISKDLMGKANFLVEIVSGR